MISILIPIYNWDATTLINSLVKQGNSINVPYEIIAIDDFSNSPHDEMNFSMNHYDFVEVYRNEKNFGRSRTRNLLAEKAQYNWLVFIDADSFVDDKFLVNYVKEIQKGESDVICGGTIYSSTPPTKNKYKLHWNYGIKREVKTASQRTKLGFKSFASNNFAIASMTFATNQFDESITEYGHEDTLLGKQLAKSGARISHIDNPVKHLGLETNEVFLEKSVTAVENLVKLFKEGKLDEKEVKQLTPGIQRSIVVKTFGKFSKNYWKKRALNKGCLFSFDVYRHAIFVEGLVG